METPILQPLVWWRGRTAFKTHHNTLDMTLYLRIANELYLKRLIVGGFDGSPGISKRLPPMKACRASTTPSSLRWNIYVAYKDYQWMMNLVEEMIEKVALDLHGTTE